MPSPRIFISSTCYDLKYIRENLKFFMRNLGYEPILSEEGNVFYDPDLNVQDACLVEVSACQMFVLIIGGKYGSRYRDTEKSITNAEFQEAVKAKIPIFALVERTVYEQFRVFCENIKNRSCKPEKIRFPAVDSTKIFCFIKEVQQNTTNNALIPFSNYEEMQSYLKQQWAGLMFRFLTSESESKRLTDTLNALSRATEKIEYLTRQVADSVATPNSKILIELSDIISKKAVSTILTRLDKKLYPQNFLKYSTVDDFLEGPINLIDTDQREIKSGGPPYEFSRSVLIDLRGGYTDLRKELLDYLKDKNVSSDDLL